MKTSSVKLTLSENEAIELLLALETHIEKCIPLRHISEHSRDCLRCALRTYRQVELSLYNAAVPKGARLRHFRHFRDPRIFFALRALYPRHIAKAA